MQWWGCRAPGKINRLASFKDVVHVINSSESAPGGSAACTQVGRRAGGQAGKQGDRQEGMQAGRQVGRRQAGRLASRQAAGRQEASPSAYHYFPHTRRFGKMTRGSSFQSPSARSMKKAEDPLDSQPASEQASE